MVHLDMELFYSTDILGEKKRRLALLQSVNLNKLALEHNPLRKYYYIFFILFLVYSLISVDFFVWYFIIYMNLFSLIIDLIFFLKLYLFEFIIYKYSYLDSF